MGAKTRLFRLKWDLSKQPALNADERFRQRNTTGCHFHTGLVALSSGAGFNSMDELQRLLKRRGLLSVEYLDGDSVEITEDDHAETSQTA